MNADRSQKIIIAVLAVLLVVVSGVLASRTFFAKTITPAPTAAMPTENQNINLPTKSINSQPINENQNTNTSPNVRSSVLNDPASVISVKWIPGGEVTDKEKLNTLFKITEPDKSYNPTIYKVGTIIDGNYKNDGLYLIQTNAMDGPSDLYLALGVADLANNRIVLPSKYANYDLATLDRSVLPAFFKIAWTDPNMTISDLSAPDKIVIKGNTYTATRSSSPVGFPNNTNAIKKVGLTTNNEPIYDRADLAFYNGGHMFGVENNDLALRLDNGEYIQYSLTIPFFVDGKIPKITWDDKTINKDDYDPWLVGGCGQKTVLDIVSGLSSSVLSVAGKTSNNEVIYTYKNENTQALKDAYSAWVGWQYNSNGSQAGDTNKSSYSDFLKERPFFFWKDPFGRIVRWTRGDLLPMAECGKPVVYLYPTETEQVAVKLGNNITVTKSEPTYQNGWKVTAEPNGTLTTTDGKTFPYLYWDGNGASYNTPTTGFVVARNNVEATLKSKLSQLGLNSKEIADFNEFWLPIVTKSPYALISFVPQDEWSKAAPLSISPAPQTVIRVFMDWKPLAAPISIAPQTLPPTPIRTGFTAVEWGGLLYR